MKYQKLSYILGALCILSGCTDDYLIKDDPAESKGKQVQFGISSDNGTTSRTYYDGKDGNAYILKWASDDRIIVASPMGEAGYNNKVYDINIANPGSDDAVAATTITPNNGSNINTPPGVGIQWGTPTEEKGSFYSIYPYRAETRRRPGDLDASDIHHNVINLNADGSATATVLVEPNQRIWRNPFTAAEIAHNTAKEPSPYLWQMYGSNHANVMWAQTDNVEYGTEVKLRYKPLSTCLMMTFTNPAGGASPVNAMIEDIKIIAPEGTIIAGEMNIKFPTTGAPTDGTQGPNTTNMLDPTTMSNYLSLVEGSSLNSNTIEIWPWIRSNQYESGIHPTLRPGDTMQVCAFLLPTCTGNFTDQWKVQVTINNKVYSCPLVKTETAIAPGKIHEIEMPPFDNLSEWTFNAASWMKDIDSSVYLSQITFPGAWYSYSATTGEKYQTWTIAEQLEKGVRAFDLSTKTMWKTVGTGWQGIPTLSDYYATLDGIGIAGSGSNTPLNYSSGGSVNGKVYYDGKDVGAAIDEIANYIHTNAPTEVGIIVISYEAGGTGGLRPIDYQAWMYGLNQVYNNLTYKDYIYTGEIKPTTTLGELRGMTILKINLSEEVCSSWNGNTNYPYNNTIPCLISFSPTRWVNSNLYVQNPTTGELEPMDPESDDYTFQSLTSTLMWKNWDTKYNNSILDGIPANRPNTWAWNFSCTNRTRTNELTYDVSEDDAKFIPNYNMRIDALNSLKQEALDAYAEQYINEMFLFGCGGTQTTSFDDSDVDPLALAEYMNKTWLKPTIQGLFDNNTPCPLGIVFLNQIGQASVTNGGQTYNTYGDEILTNLIKMNDAFYLQRNPNYTPTPTTKTTDVPSGNENYASGAAKDPNGWSAF